MDQRGGSATGSNTDGNEGGIGIVKKRIHQPAQADVQKIARRMRLMHARIKAVESQREVHRIDVIKKMTAKEQTRHGNGAHQKNGILDLARLHRKSLSVQFVGR